MDCVQNIRKGYPFLIPTLKNLVLTAIQKQKQKLKEPLARWASYETICLTYILSDLLNEIKILFKFIQKSNTLAFQQKDQLGKF